jgi:superoxide dismutase, Cu-Zn family
MKFHLTLLMGLALVSCSRDSKMAQGPADRGERARAAGETVAAVVLGNAQREEVGRATLTQTSEGVRIAGNVSNLSPGQHGIHIHEKGLCEAPTFESAGGHYNPTAMSHGGERGEQRHIGDLGNIMVGEDGRAAFDVTAQGATLREGSASLFHTGGTSLIVHAKADDLRSNPAGNSGERVACGVIKRQ